MPKPTRLFDLHTHLFNARYLPLASIIANAMRKDESKLASGVAKLLEALAGSSYEKPHDHKNKHGFVEEGDEFYLSQIWQVTEFELRNSAPLLKMKVNELISIDPNNDSIIGADEVRTSEVMRAIIELSTVDYEAEGWIEENSNLIDQFPSFKALENSENIIDWSEKVVKKSLRIVTRLMNPDAWGTAVGAAESYLKFFLTLLGNEEKIVEKIFSSYGDELRPSLKICHFMMDMQLAYAKQKSPRYSFYPTQLDNMQKLQLRHKDKVFGFSAFDPRRKNEAGDWRPFVEGALEKGFIGFKFYPAMGFRPSGNETSIQSVIDDFFDFCVAKDIPIFTHCTPRGFQTRMELGYYAHPNGWAAVLQNPRWKDLRLCLGHAGGGRDKNGSLFSAGWMAKSDKEWDHTDNFAKIVANLCKEYPNVYCEIGNITEMLEGSQDLFISNLQRALKEPGKYHLLDKIAYGSDWHMPPMINHNHDFLESWISIFDREAYAPYRERFFWKNAYDYLKLPY